MQLPPPNWQWPNLTYFRLRGRQRQRNHWWWAWSLKPSHIHFLRMLYEFSRHRAVFSANVSQEFNWCELFFCKFVMSKLVSHSQEVWTGLMNCTVSVDVSLLNISDFGEYFNHCRYCFYNHSTHYTGHTDCAHVSFWLCYTIIILKPFL